MNIIEQLNENIPNHVAVIMDGNGRWAKKQGYIRAIGHETGTKAVREIVEAATNLGIGYLTLYAFSTENWNRPKLEIEALMKLLVKSLKKDLPLFMENEVKLNVIGNVDALPEKAIIFSLCVLRVYRTLRLLLHYILLPYHVL